MRSSAEEDYIPADRLSKQTSSAWRSGSEGRPYEEYQGWKTYACEEPRSYNHYNRSSSHYEDRTPSSYDGRNSSSYQDRNPSSYEDRHSFNHGHYSQQRHQDWEPRQHADRGHQRDENQRPHWRSDREHHMNTDRTPLRLPPWRAREHENHAHWSPEVPHRYTHVARPSPPASGQFSRASATPAPEQATETPLQEERAEMPATAAEVADGW